MESRFGERHKKRKQNRILNSLIAIVFVLILIVGANLFRGTPGEKAHSDDPSHNEDVQNVENNEQVNEASIEYNKTDTDSDHLGQAEDEFVEDEEKPDTELVDGAYSFSGEGGLEGPWGPIGTKQSGEHVTTYEKDTLDWNEMTLAITYGAGLLDEEVIIWWIGNGGHPQRAIGRISSKADPETRYQVTIEWVDQEGWQPIDVTIENE